MKKNTTVNIKMYQVGELGDCFLLHFVSDKHESNVLIDCGSFRNSAASKGRLGKIVENIKSQLKGKKLDVVGGTHQHNDHLSGFVHCESQFTNEIKQVWLSWLDDPKDALARTIQKDQKNLVAQLKAINEKLTALKLSPRDNIIGDVLGFYAAAGDDPEIPARGIEILKKIGEEDVAYLSPGQQMELPGLLNNTVKVYVLGPPAIKNYFSIKIPKNEKLMISPRYCRYNTSQLCSALNNRGSAADSWAEDGFLLIKDLKEARRK